MKMIKIIVTALLTSLFSFVIFITDYIMGLVLPLKHYLIIGLYAHILFYLLNDKEN